MQKYIYILRLIESNKMSAQKQIRMRPVTSVQSMHRSFNRIIDGDDELKSRQVAVGGDPYQSMYSQAFGPRQASQKSLTLER